MRVISIQSQVVHGHVGNSAAAWPMQARGLEVAAVPTAILSNHPHYPTMHGTVLDPDLLAGLLKGVEERGLIETSAALLTGFLGSVENARIVADFAAGAKARNPALRFVCDPVMGDDDLGVFVAPGLVAAFRDRLVPLADLITPNQFELELLSGLSARTESEVHAALSRVRAPGQDAIVTGCVLADTASGHVETLAWTDGVITRSAIPHVPIRPCGTGDLFTALVVADLVAGVRLAETSLRATQVMLAVLRRTETAKTGEMALAGFPF